MGLEIERKFLIDSKFASGLSGGTLMKQGYLPTHGLISVRLRLAGERGILTIKGPSDSLGMQRSEYEYAIPKKDADEMIAELCHERIVEKVRYHEIFAGRSWDIDVFHGLNAGLYLAEVEIEDSNAVVELPPWIVEEVTGDERYFNQQLAESPYSRWK